MRHSPRQLVSLPKGSGPLHLRLHHKIRSLILAGSWPPDTRLPSSRDLARDLGISRNTAILAIDRLIADGLARSRPGSGVFVTEAAFAGAPSSSTALEPPAPFQLAYGGVDLFPAGRWARIQARVWSSASRNALYEGSGAGFHPLRRAVAAHLHATRGLPCSAEQIMIVSGTQSAIDLALRVLGERGGRAWMEDPGHPYVRQAIQANGLNSVAVPVDSDGLRVADAIAAAPDARLAYVTPACQFPTCSTLSEARRLELLDWAEAAGAWIIEDDWDHDARFDGSPPPEPLASRSGGRALYIHSFNRILFPGLRIAALVVPESLVPALVDARRAIDGFSSLSNQIALAEFIERGYLASHLRSSRIALAARRTAMHGALTDMMRNVVTFDPAQPGLHVVARPTSGGDAALAAMARRAGLECLALSTFSERGGAAPQALLLGFAAFAPNVLARAVKRLASSLSGPASEG